MKDHNGTDHSKHDIEPYAQAHETKAPKIHEGIFWCHDCEREFVPDEERPARQT